jgi:hypothetical protein
VFCGARNSRQAESEKRPHVKMHWLLRARWLLFVLLVLYMRMR